MFEKPALSSHRQIAQKDLAAVPLQVEVVIEIPRGSFLKRRADGQLDFISPDPCPFNYGSVGGYIGHEGDPLDAVVLGPRLRRGARVAVQALGAVELIDRGILDDKLICGDHPVGPAKRFLILLFFKFYALCKGLINLARGRSGRNSCEGWRDARAALERSKLSEDLRPPTLLS
jgi:inorganic pyrophosphatase